MAELYPFSSVTVERLRAVPDAGSTHRWLAQVASGLRGCLGPEACVRFLRDCCDRYVTHRAVPDREIEAAVMFAYSTQQGTAGRTPKWPEPDRNAIERVIRETPARFDVDPGAGLKPADVLPGLFEAGELVCTGVGCDRAQVRTLEEAMTDAEWQQFVVVNPMKGLSACNQNGEVSARCQSNVERRRHLVAEFDDPTLSKADQAGLASRLGDFAPLVMVVDSGGKSLHAWFRVEGMQEREQARFFAVACALGADRTRWDSCGWLRMPGGLRRKEPPSRKATAGQAAPPVARQRILYFDPNAGSPAARCVHSERVSRGGDG